MPRAKGMAGRPDLQGGGARDRADTALDSCLAGAADDRPVYSPPLSPEEIADIKAVASGAVKLRRVSKSEFLRMLAKAAEPDAAAARRVQ